jgi:hypothetical protein
MRIKSLWSITIRAAQDWWEDNCLRLAGVPGVLDGAVPGASGAAPRRPTGMVLGREAVVFVGVRQC